MPDSRRVFAVFEQPDLKATFQFTVTAPERVAGRLELPHPRARRSTATASATWTFEPTPRISSYITALVAGPYESTTSELTSASGRVIPLGVYARKSLWQHLDADYVFDITRKGFAYFEEKFGYPYPFAKYDQLFVPEFNAGAMENAGAVTFTETYVFRSKVTDAVKERRVVTILHELAHMWFGDLVTMKWWNDLWLNESFAEWASTIATAEATEWTEAWTTFNAMEKTWAYRQDQLPSTHPVVAEINDLEDVQVNFDGITYAKGGSVLKQLAAWVGIDEFFAGVAQYFQQHEWSNTELSDLLSELEKTSGRELATWSKKWLETAGVNTLSPEIATDADGQDHAVRDRPDRAGGLPDDPPAPPRGRLLQRSRATASSACTTSSSTSTATSPRSRSSRASPSPDLVLLNDEDLAYAKIRLDAVSLRTAIEHLAQISDPLARSLVWGAAWDQTRDAEASATDYIDLVLRNIGAETESTTVRTTLAQLQLAANSYVSPEKRVGRARAGRRRRCGSSRRPRRPAATASCSSSRRSRARPPPPRSGSRCAPLRDGRRHARRARDRHRPLVAAARLARRRRRSPPSSRSTRRSRPTTPRRAASSPRRPRRRCRRRRAKQAAWDSLIDEATTCRTRSSASTAAGFAPPGRRRAARRVRPAVLRHAAADLELAHLPDRAVPHRGSLPRGAREQGAADATRAWLAANSDAAPALRRLVNENLAGVERALAVQERDAQ